MIYYVSPIKAMRGAALLVYHGSNVVVDTPRLLPQNRYLDFGPGFYTTTNREQETGRVAFPEEA